MEIENELLKEYKEYIISNISYSIKILPKTPQSLSSFPTIIFKEASNVDYIRGKTLNGLEYMDRVTYTINIYTKDIKVNNNIVNSRQIMQELKQLTFEFFRQAGFNRTSCEHVDFPDFTIDRLVIVEQGKINNWNKKII